MLSTIFNHEWTLFKRQKVELAALTLFFIIGLLSIHNGYRVIQIQHIQTDSIGRAYRTDLERALAQFTDTSTPSKKTQSAFAGLPEVVNFRLPQNAILLPRPLAMLSLGQSAFQSYNQQVKTTIDFTAPSNAPVSNPSRLFAGNFDLSFVLVYLLPLLIIAFCYPIYAMEKDQGTLTMLAVQGASLQRIILMKLLFRLIIFTILVMVLNIIGFVAASFLQAVGFVEVICWVGFSFAYLLLWLALCYLIIAFKRPAPATAMTMAGAWILLLVVIPAVLNMYLFMRYPIPMRDTLSSFERHTGEELWEGAPKMLADSFFKNNPKFAELRDPANDSLRRSKVFTPAFFDLKERTVQRVADLLDREVALHNRAAEKVAAWYPPLRVQTSLAAIAGTDRQSYQQFKLKVSGFQRIWRDFLYTYQLKDRPLQPKEFYTFPAFDTSRPPILIRNFVPAISQLVFIALLVYGLAFFRFKRKTL